jgi:hypothetical protein
MILAFFAIVLVVLVLLAICWYSPQLQAPAQHVTQQVSQHVTVVVNTSPQVDVSSIALLILSIAALVWVVVYAYRTFRRED